MLKWFKNLLRDWNHVQDELAAMGIFTNPYGSYFSKEMFEEYCKHINKSNPEQKD